MNEQIHTERAADTGSNTRPRPRWARRIFHLGDDLRWAMSGWADFPRPIRRLTVATVSTVAAYLLDVDATLEALLSVISRD